MRWIAILAVASACALPLWAQGGADLPDFDAQSKALSAPRVDTVDQLRDQGRALLGKTVELRGVVQGVSEGGNSLSILLELPGGQTQVISATPSFKSSPAGRAGNWVRLLCRVQATVGDDALLQLVNASAKRPTASDADSDKGATLAVPAYAPGAPPPSQVLAPETTTDTGIVIGPEVELPAALPVPKRDGATRRRDTATPKRDGAPRTIVPRDNAFYGFDDPSRAAFASLALRTNPRLGSDRADEIATSLLDAAQSQHLDPRFLAAVVQVESGFNPYAVSGAGAMGLGQLMPFNLRPLGVYDAWDPAQNLRGAARLLRQNLNVYARDANGTMLAVAAYHAGVGAVNRAGRAIPKATTQKYVWKVYYAYRALAPELFR